jgi:outer membrane protein OmpA-like peptidoglycan-associated protein
MNCLRKYPRNRPIKFRLAFAVLAILLFTATGVFAQQEAQESSADVAFWVGHWAQPRVVLFGPEEQAFNDNVHEILFPWNDHEEPSNPAALEDNVRWLKDHSDDRFYIHGYASSRGELIYNLALSQRRANWVKQTLIDRGIPESRIVIAVGWGQLYPICAELNDDCWAKNRRVRFSYSPN